MKISIINGPNLNLLGTRQPDVYGGQTFEDYLKSLKENYQSVEFHYFQSNVEGELINEIQKSALNSDGIILNGAAYTHTSVALGDAVASIDVPVIEVHISNIHARERFRHHSYISANAAGVIVGFGLEGYRLAVESITSKF